MSSRANGLTNKTAIVTGAAHGIGRAIAVRLAEDGATVALLDIDKAELAAAGAQIPHSLPIDCDITNDDDVAHALARIMETTGRIDVLVNNAGGATIPPKPFWEMTAGEWRFVIDFNLTAQWALTKHVVGPMREQESGKIINIASLTGINGSAGLCAYASAKAGLIGMTRTMARELGAFGINVNAVAPGMTRFTHPKSVLTDAEARALGDSVRQRQALKTGCEPEHTAAAVSWLASDDASQVTGQIIRVDGGRFA